MSRPKEGTDSQALPPVATLAVGVLILIVAGGIYMAAQIPGPVTLAPAIALLVAAWLILLGTGAALVRVREFAWGPFRKVGGWALLAYGISAGVLELVFVLDHVPGPALVVLSLMLLVYAIDIPLILAFSVARHQPIS